MTRALGNMKNKRAILSGIFIVLATLFGGETNISARMQATVSGVLAAQIIFLDPTREVNAYRNGALWVTFWDNGNGITSGHVEGGMDGSTWVPERYWEIFPVIAPGVYNFHVTYSVPCSNPNTTPGGHSCAPITWSAHIGIGYSEVTTMYLYNQPTLNLTLNYGETMYGTIIVDDAGQTRKLEKAPETDNQENLVGSLLPKPLKVQVTGTGAIAKEGIPVSFSVIPATANYSFSETGSVKTITVNTIADGTASVPFRLGTVSETYSIKAVCDSCAAGKEVTFSAKALTNEQVTELSIVQCDKYATVDTKVRNAFIVRVFNTLTRKGEENWMVNFSTETFPIGAVGQKASPATGATNELGIAFGSLWTGGKTGGYVFAADCPSCQKNRRVSCSIQAGALPDVMAVPPDEGPEAGDPSETPMLRISNIDYPNDDVSFTTNFGESKIKLAADLKPDTPEYNTLSGDIAWSVEDSPADAMDSGDLVDPAKGPATEFYVNHPYVPTAEKGRLLPLKYKLQASVMTPKGLVKSYPRHIKQDAIDKCRQEYIDYVTPTGKKLDVSVVPRSRFSPGVNSEFVLNPLDCYAYIYPSRAQEVLNLRELYKGTFETEVKSGYRSPRKNFNTPGASETSWHMYGNAVDISPNPNTSTNKNILWPSIASPKMLEKSSTPNVILKYLTSGEVKIIRNRNFNTKYNPKDTNGDGITDTIQDGDTILQVKDLPWDTLKKYLADSNTNGVPNILENTEWMHLGE
ncbi:MAG: hypothetical protein A2X34_06495 [Elusimicrobia bacterium GWC2_51_8]|nr:MAG: hypothetical protein A2X33_07345 [Elusimicrobia bacterium GWA2_51_34]OGR61905.1 MAG: hypothetical protein A2X34_06495 [Elusimicrobia bacterium GWC2_51_8]OGR85522.1 MAG: hypothetical protein A2021_02405 [Elusimicrobia bacterium GWF2_52_66]HAF95285.1 hypothetical protein [Elusimicrobiota bacterium]HCE96943.1 hypothetical protein [Elusimicrobiota bacterium]